MDNYKNPLCPSPFSTSKVSKEYPPSGSCNIVVSIFFFLPSSPITEGMQIGTHKKHERFGDKNHKVRVSRLLLHLLSC